ncbi:Invertase [Castilleja foliolosa]|uniref:Invertase n=1 Tax=Castilleja foliolosa TaxID=1961234 RepID=A0ABD3C2N4_9LAMI
MKISAVIFHCLFLFSLALISKNGVQASHKVYMHLLESVPAVDVKQVHRTGYHFQPPRNWINDGQPSDPNGPMYFNGTYHLFYQYNPKGAVWGNIVWAHSVSKDLINWQRLENAIYPSKPFDKYGCWSGSATILPGNKPVILYTGIIDANNTQVQNYAIPADISDPYLRKWVKPDNNPLIVADKSINKTAFRDPTTAWLGQDGRWRISIGGRRKNRGIAYLYRSKDFVNWVKAQHPLHSTARTGNWECPDFFPVSAYGKNGLEIDGMDTLAEGSTVGSNVKYVLKVSLDVTRYEYYTLGTYSSKTDKYIPDKGMIDGWNGLRYDYGNFYASKSFFDPSKNRRILWGWANESDSTADDVKKGWAGIQLIPRTISLDPKGKQLLQWPIEEVEKLRGKKIELSSKKLVKGDKVEITGITAAQADVDVTFSFNSLDRAEPFHPSWDRYDAQKLCSQKGSTVEGGLGPFGLLTLASKKLEEYTPVFFRVFKAQDKPIVLMCSDASRSTLKDGIGTYRPSFAGFVDVDLTQKKLSLRSLIDHSVVESFGAGGKTCISSRVYPTLAVYNNAHLYAFNNGTQIVTIDSLSAWSMNNPQNMNQ